MTVISSINCVTITDSQSVAAFIPKDVKELEFVSALMQTDDPIRVDGTLHPRDIALYLNSRFGLDITVETVDKLIFKDLSGPTIRTDEEPSLDLCQLVAILAIPPLLEAAKGGNRDILDWFKNTFDEVLQGRKLTRKTLREVFESYDEFGVADDVLDSMIQAAGGPNGSLEQGLVGDLDRFDLNWKNQYTTNLEDVLSAQTAPVPESSERKDAQNDLLLRQKITASFIDFIADNYRRHSFVACLWGAGVATYVSHIFLVTDAESYDYWAEVNCDDNLSATGCSIVKGVVTWLATMVQLATLGFAFIVLGSMGNSIFSTLYKVWSTVGLVMAMGVVAISTIAPYFVVSSVKGSVRPCIRNKN